MLINVKIMSRESYLLKFAGASMLAGGMLVSSLWGWCYVSQKEKYEQKIQALEVEKAALVERIPKTSQLEDVKPAKLEPTNQPTTRRVEY